MALPPNKPGAPSAAILNADGLVDATPEELQAELLKIFLSPNYRPPVLPKVAIELTELTRNPTATYDDVVSVLQKDPLVVAGVMRVAQSPLYAGRSPLQSLKEAVQRLGLNSLRDIVWQVVAGMRLFRGKGVTAILERLQAHSLFMAYAARSVAASANVPAEHAFLCGLLHDVGISGTLLALSETNENLPVMSLLEAIDGMHEQAGGLMAKNWRLSPEIVSVIEQHHRFDPNRSEVPLLTAVLCVAEHMAHELDYGILDSTAALTHKLFDRNVPGRYLQALKRLNLEGKESELRVRGEDVAKRLEGML